MIATTIFFITTHSVHVEPPHVLTFPPFQFHISLFSSPLLTFCHHDLYIFTFFLFLKTSALHTDAQVLVNSFISALEVFNRFFGEAV